MRRKLGVRQWGLLLLGACALTSCGPKTTPVEAAGAFFSHIQKGDTDAAYDSAAFTLQARQTKNDFAANLRDLNFAQFQSVEWQETTIDEKEARLKGELTRGDGVKQIVTIEMVREDGHWRVATLRARDAGRPGQTASFNLGGRGVGIGGFGAHQPPPAEAQAKALVQETLREFNESLRKKDFGSFYNYVSHKWQQQLTEQRLQNAFRPFIDIGANFDSAVDIEPVFDQPPVVTSDGLLSLSGVVPTSPYRLAFSLKYIYELPRWRLFAIELKVVE